MKWLSIIFAFYLLTLSCVPCLCDDLQPTQQTTKQDNHKKDNSKENNCNPFCTCASCISGVCIPQNTIQILPTILFSKEQKISCNNQQFSSYNSHNIWQPPKLS